jgi:hypothetical protein
MRRWFAGIGVAVGLVVLVAGCARPDGTDGDLTDEWASPPEARIWKPEAGVCLKSYLTTGTLSDYRPLDCAEEHAIETVHVGEFTGDAGKRDAPPPDDSTAGRGAYDECLAKSKEFLGDDHRTGRVRMQVIKPSTNAWSGGARWFRCDLMEYHEDSTVRRTRTGSLRDALAAQGSLRLGCFTITEKDDKFDPFKPVACDKPHNGEFAGLFVPKDLPYPKTDAQQWDVMGRGCYGVVAAFTGLKDDSSLPRRINFVYTYPSEQAWDLGDRAVVCTLYLDKNATKSMKGAGPGAFPVK